jgi:hypothetical protein
LTLRQAYWSASSMSIQSRKAIKPFHHMKIIIVTSLVNMSNPSYLGLTNMLDSRYVLCTWLASSPSVLSLTNMTDAHYLGLTNISGPCYLDMSDSSYYGLGCLLKSTHFGLDSPSSPEVLIYCEITIFIFRKMQLF